MSSLNRMQLRARPNNIVFMFRTYNICETLHNSLPAKNRDIVPLLRCVCLIKSRFFFVWLSNSSTGNSTATLATVSWPTVALCRCIVWWRCNNHWNHGWCFVQSANCNHSLLQKETPFKQFWVHAKFFWSNILINARTFPQHWFSRTLNSLGT